MPAGGCLLDDVQESESDQHLFVVPLAFLIRVKDKEFVMGHKTFKDLAALLSSSLLLI